MAFWYQDSPMGESGKHDIVCFLPPRFKTSFDPTRAKSVCVANMPVATTMSSELFAIFDDCRVQGDAKQWFFTEGILEIRDLGLMASAEDKVDDIIQLAGSANVSMDTIQQKMSTRKAWTQCRQTMKRNEDCISAAAEA